MSKKLTHYLIIGVFAFLYLCVSIISTIHVIDFFNLSNSLGMSIFLAIAFEIGAAASLASIIVLEKMNKFLIWGLFLILTAMQAMGNVYFSFVHLVNYNSWIQLVGLDDIDPITQKRVLAIISGAVLPIVALGFIKALVDYIKPTTVLLDENNKQIEKNFEDVIDINKDKNNAIVLEEVVKPDIINTPQEQENIEVKEEINIEDQSDIKLKDATDEYINQTKSDSLLVHPKTTPGIG